MILRIVVLVAGAVSLHLEHCEGDKSQEGQELDKRDNSDKGNL